MRKTLPKPKCSGSIFSLSLYYLLSLISLLSLSVTVPPGTVDSPSQFHLELLTHRQYYSNVSVTSVYGIVDGQNLLKDRHFILSSMFCTYIQTNRWANHPSDSSQVTPRKRLLARLLARDFLRETHRERLLRAGGECNNQPSMRVAKVMDRTAAGEG